MASGHFYFGFGGVGIKARSWRRRANVVIEILLQLVSGGNALRSKVRFPTQFKKCLDLLLYKTLAKQSSQRTSGRSIKFPIQMANY
jgi:hypothetical protein